MGKRNFTSSFAKDVLIREQFIRSLNKVMVYLQVHIQELLVIMAQYSHFVTEIPFFIEARQILTLRWTSFRLVLF